ncbi:MAG: diguanylate cyclase [Frankiales bacterium]|jgi:diguanylate cyclase (GGDEF)-like protein|nr:diguanylate cyclase [Frankiales bacterium]
MRQSWRAWSFVLLAIGVTGWLGFLAIPVSSPASPLWFMAVAGIGTGMSIAGIWQGPRSRRRIWVAMALGQLLFLIGDGTYYLYEWVLHIAPYPSPADAAYLLRYGAIILALGWLVRGRRKGRDRAAFLDAAIVSSAFALLALIFLIIPAAQGSGVGLLSKVVASAYPIGDVFVLAILVQLVTTRAARNLAFVSIATGLVAMLANNAVYTLVVASGGTLPDWQSWFYLAPYLLIGFGAMHPSGTALTEPAPSRQLSTSNTRVLALGCAALLGPLLLSVLFLTGAGLNAIPIAIGSAVSTILVLTKLVGLIHRAEAQSTQLATFARTDSLTGVANRRTWDFELERAITLAHAEGSTLTVAVIDLDHFKQYNDAHGHIAGDLVLKETTAAWTTVLDGRGFLARYGGEEFTLLIADSTPTTVEPLLQRLNQAVSRGQTCSIGVTAWRPTEDPAHATARADAALFEAKRTGRNRIIIDDAGGLRRVQSLTPDAVQSGLRRVVPRIPEMRTATAVGPRK